MPAAAAHSTQLDNFLGNQFQLPGAALPAAGMMSGLIRPAMAAGKTKLQFMYPVGVSGDINKIVTGMISRFNEEHPEIEVEAEKFSAHGGCKTCVVYGGAPKGPQLGEVRRGVYIIIVTPGRLNDFLEAGQVRMHQVNYVVMDEADRMLDMGFEPQIRKIISHVPRGYQSLMYTATWPREVRSMASEFQRRPYQITIGTADEKLTANKDVEQRVLLVGSPQEKDGHLISQINTLEPGSRVLIFCSTKRMCDTLCRALARQIGCNAMDGDKEQRERERILHEFKTGRSPIMVATDVAARGLDIKLVTHVINYDMARDVESYVHRIGRTGRAGAVGKSVTFWNPDYDKECAPALVRIARKAKQEVPDWLAKFEKSKANKQWNVEKADKELDSLAADVVAAVK